MLTELRLQFDKPDIIVRPAVEKVGMLDKVDVHRIVVLGEEAMIARINDLRKLTTWPNRMKRRYFTHRQGS